MENNSRIQHIEKPAKEKCAGFSQKIGNTTFEVSCFYSDKAREFLNTKMKRRYRELEMACSDPDTFILGFYVGI